MVLIKKIEDSEQFKQYMLNDLEDIDLVMCYFTASWCGPCKHISSTVENIGQNNSHIKVLKIDVDECEDISEHYEIECMPTFKFFKPGELESIHTFSGASDEELLNTINSLLKSKLNKNIDENCFNLE